MTTLIAQRPIQRSSPIAIALGVIAFVILWVLFAPMALGGQSAYVIINGNSMYPLYQRGDLVILHRSASPQVGDIVAYRHPEIGPIIHRIISTDGDKFIFQGDNNDWVDSYKPAFSELIGKAWLHFPRLGTAILWLRQPLVLAALTAIIGGLIMLDLFTGTAKKNSTARAAPTPAVGMSSGLREALIFIFTLLALTGLGLGIFAFTRPVTTSAADNYDYVQTAAFHYSAPADPSLYNSSVVQPGEPVFDRLTCNINIAMAYALSATQPVDVSGSYRILAQVSEVNGWKHTFELQPRTPFSGGAFNSRVSFNLCEVRTLVERLMEMTGMQRSLFNVAVMAEINSAGSIGGRGYATSVTPSLMFGLDNSQLYLIENGSSQPNPLHWEQQGSLAGVRSVVNTLSLLGLSMPVSLARWIALTIMLIGLLGLAGAGIPLLLAAQQNELAGIYARYAHLIVKVRGQSRQVGTSQPTVDVASMDDLARIAQQAGTLIMENVFTGEHLFLVFAHGQCFRYAVAVKE